MFCVIIEYSFASSLTFFAIFMQYISNPDLLVDNSEIFHLKPPWEAAPNELILSITWETIIGKKF